MVLGKDKANPELSQGSCSADLFWLLLLARTWQIGDKVLNNIPNLILEERASSGNLTVSMEPICNEDSRIISNELIPVSETQMVIRGKGAFPAAKSVTSLGS